MKKRSFRSIALILTLLMVFYSIPLSVFAEMVRTEDEKISARQSATPISEKETSSLVKTVTEAVERREKNVKHFRLEDGSYTLVRYDTAVHYRDTDGKWQDIDNTLEETAGNYVSGDARIKFAKKITGNETLFTLHEGNRKITFSLDGARKKTVGKVTNTETVHDEKATTLQKMMTLDGLSSRILYEEILDGIDLEYVLDAGTVKENIIVKEPKESYSYTFTLKLNNLVPTLAEDGSVLLADETDGETVYLMPAPIVFDADGTYAEADDAFFTLTAQKNGSYSLTVTADAAWMNDEGRAYPVTIDPAIGTADTASMTDTYVDEENPNTLYYNFDFIAVGQGANGQKFEGYWKMTTLPALPANAYIVSAAIDLYNDGYYENYANVDVESLTVYAAPVTSAWSGTGTTWNTKPSKDAAVGFQILKATDIDTYCRFDLTSIVSQWYEGAAVNHGIAFYSTEPSYTHIRFSSSETNRCPRFIVNYRDMKGLEDYWSFGSQDVGYAGVGAVNYATGNLVFSIGTLTSTDYLMPFTPSLVYNSLLAGEEYEYPQAEVSYISTHAPRGFKMNTKETVVKKSIITESGTSTFCYVYTDADATEHYFLPAKDEDGAVMTGEYYDENGLGLELNEVSASLLTITDRDYTVRSFSLAIGVPTGSNYESGWYLSSVTDKSGNQLLFSFDSGKRPVTVSIQPYLRDAVTQLKIAYVDYKPAVIYNPTSGHAAVLRYSATPTGALAADREYLREIVYAYGSNITEAQWLAYSQNASANTGITAYATASYTYDEAGRLIAASDNKSLYRVEYTYTGDKVTAITEYAGANDTVGKTVGITYGVGYTEVRTSGSNDQYNDYDDVIMHMTFDSAGRPVSAYETNIYHDTVFGASGGIYEQEIDRAANHLKSTYTSKGSSVNYLANGSFERGANKWTLSGAYADDGAAMHGTKSLMLPALPNATTQATQYVSLPEGNYTLTFHVQGPHATGSTLTVGIENLHDYPNSQMTTVPASIYEQKGEYTVYSIPFTTSSSYFDGDDVSEDLKITFTVKGNASASGGVYIDAVSITQGTGVADYSLLEAGSFSQTEINASGEGGTSPASYWMSPGGQIASTESADAPMNSVMCIPQNPNGETERGQTVTTLSGSTNWYKLEGFGKLEKIANHPESVFALKVEIFYTDDPDEENPEIIYVPFNLYTTDWQYLSTTFRTGPSPASIRVSCVYGKHLGEAYFDNLSLVPIVGQTAVDYEYTDAGLVKEAHTPDSDTYYYYDSENQMVGCLADTVYTKYIYDEKHRIKDELTCIYQLADRQAHTAINDNGTIGNGDVFVSKNSVSYEYNSFGQPVQTSTFASYTENGHSTGHTLYNTRCTYVVDYDSHIIGALASMTDELDKTTRYEYNDNTGTLTYVLYPDGKSGLYYEYDNFGMLTATYPINVSSTGTVTKNTADEKALYQYNVKEKLENLTTASTAYTFTYDDFGNVTEIKAGSYVLAQYAYKANNGKLTKITFVDGSYYNYSYNSRGMLQYVYYKPADSNRSLVCSYRYDDDGNLIEMSDKISGDTYRYEYDSKGRLIRTLEGDSSSSIAVSFSYDDLNRLQTHQEIIKLSGVSVIAPRINTYDASSRLSDSNLFVVDDWQGATFNTQYTYDHLDRLTTQTDAVTSGSSDFTATRTYEYTVSGQDSQSSQISKITQTIGNQGAQEYRYTYDDQGNIVSIANASGVIQYRYEYDDLNQLVREDNRPQNKTSVFTYDDAGNLTSEKIYAFTFSDTLGTATSTYDYGYANSTWGDLLTSYRGQTITYDANGQPLVYYNGQSYTFTWSQGRLASATKGGVTTTYTYNPDGIRTSKTVGTVTHDYILDGSRIVGETYGTVTTLYFYGADGSVLGFARRDTSESTAFEYYYYEKNLQGDVVGIFTSAGQKVIWYNYDAWGYAKGAHIAGSDKYESMWYENPFRYRGYYYDRETGFYYLQSRYYDLNTGRFISPDRAYVSTGQGLIGNNTFAYCGNDPINRVDPTGQFWSEIWDSIINKLKKLYQAGHPLMVWAAEIHYSRNELNKAATDVNDVLENYVLQPESKDLYHEYTHGKQGEEAIYNNKYLSPNGGHYEVIVCQPPNKAPYIVDESVDPINMGTYNFASNSWPKYGYQFSHYWMDVFPYLIFGNTKADG